MKKGSESYSISEAERYIKDRSSAWAESVATSDPAIVQEILADDFVWVLDGKVLDKSRAVQRAQDGSGDFLSNHLDYANVHFFGDTAIAQGSETWTRKGGHKGHSVWIDTWVRRDGKWQIVAAADVSVPINEWRLRPTGGPLARRHSAASGPVFRHRPPSQFIASWLRRPVDAVPRARRLRRAAA